MPEEKSKKAWYAVHTYSGYEKKVQESLLKRAETMNMEDYILRCVVPEEKVSEMKNDAHRTVMRKTFPGYVFIEMVLTDESWYVVRNTTGVTGFVGTGNKAVPLQEHEVAPLLRSIDNEEAAPVVLDVGVGDSVHISDPAFADFIGTVTDIDEEKRKLKVSVPLFGGRETSVELDFEQVRAVK